MQCSAESDDIEEYNDDQFDNVELLQMDVRKVENIMASDEINQIASSLVNIPIFRHNIKKN